MRVVVQRVSRASVTVYGRVVGEIGCGLLVLLGVGADDEPAEVADRRIAWLAEKVANLRVFADAEGKMNRSLLEVGGGALVVSQFTLHGDCRKGRRPNFMAAAPPDLAEPLYERFCIALLEQGVRPVQRGEFGAMMDVALVNDGPVTLVVDAP